MLKAMGIVTNATASLQAILAGESGLAWALSENDPVIGGGAKAGDIRLENIALDVAEKSPQRYPSVSIYCERFTNTQREKFSVVSGTLTAAIEIRASGNSVAAVSEQTSGYAAAIMKVLDCHKGEWTAGIQYCGGYDVAFQQIKRGGTQLIQVTKITVPLQVIQR
ncbi:MAG: hypothetical protein JNK48_35035 [Bryobacterales bacterium]|nr:hypothetical protein [Bryobacterales bacterium]